MLSKQESGTKVTLMMKSMIKMTMPIISWILNWKLMAIVMESFGQLPQTSEEFERSARHVGAA